MEVGPDLATEEKAAEYIHDRWGSGQKFGLGGGPMIYLFLSGVALGCAIGYGVAPFLDGWIKEAKRRKGGKR